MTGVVVAGSPLDRLSRRFQGVQLRFAALQGQARELHSQKSRLTSSISLAKARLELAPQAAEVFTYLQEKAHRRAVGEFEDLLSAFVSDVIPDAGAIKLVLGTQREAPSLDILVDNGGDLENIVEGNGGGLTNVVVTGLGYSALSRTRNRQLMLLDEPDCWLKAVNVPAFTKVIAEVANPSLADDGTALPGCQTLMVSHNDIGLMDEGAHIQDLRTEYDLAAFAARRGVDVVHVGTPGPCAYVVWVEGAAGGKPTIEVRYRHEGERDDENNALTKGFPYLDSIGGARAWADDVQPGVRWIEAINVRRHVHTRMELSSGLNVLTGGVNGGKSTLHFTAFRSMAYGESDDSMIRHGANEAVIRMGLENGVVLEMVRKRKGSPKVIYRIFHAGNPKPVHEGPQERVNSAPSFIVEALRIARVDGLDIQLRSQKEPVFLLNESAPRRAQLLSVGRESGMLQDLIERQRLQVRRDKESTKREEIELNSVNRTLLVMGPLAGMPALVDIMTSLFEDAVTLSGAVAQTRELLATLAPLEGKAALFDLCAESLKHDLAAPKLHNVSPLVSLVDRINRTQYAGRVADIPEVPGAGQLADTTELARLLQRLAIGAAQLPDMPDTPVTPLLADTKALALLTERLAGGVHAAAMVALLPELPVLGALTDTSGLREIGVALRSRTEALTVAGDEHKEAETEAVAAEEALHQLKHELGACPVCDKPFDEGTHEI